MSPERIQLRRIKGWRLPENAVSVTRPGQWGNPFAVGDRVYVSWVGAVPRTRHGLYDPAGTPVTYDLGPGETTLTAEMAVALYRETLVGNLADGDRYYDALRYGLSELRGKDLACWCPLDQPCHADVLLEIANEARCIDCDAPVRPTPPEFYPTEATSGTPAVSKVEWWTGKVLYCWACFDALDEEGASS